MVNSKPLLTVALVVILLGLLAACGKDNQSETLAPRDAKTGKTFQSTNEMLTEVKAQRPFEYDIVYEVTKDNPDAMMSYEKYNSTTQDSFDKPSFIDKEGSQISKEDFIITLETLNLKGDFENVLTLYYQNIEKGFYKEAFEFIQPKAPFSELFGNREEVFNNAQEQTKGIVRITDVLPSEFKIIEQGNINYVQVTFRLTGFWTRQVLEGPPDSITNSIEKKKVESPTPPANGQMPDIKNKQPKINWQYNASGKTIFRLINVNGKWLIYAQI
jgi:hypothetical protein